LDFASILDANFPVRSLKLAPEIRIMSLVKDVTYPVEITNDNAPYALPYWHSQALARYILDNPETFAGRTTLDVGCGAGVAAIAAARVGAISTGLDPDLRCLCLTERNAAINGTSVGLVWGTHKASPPCDILIAGGVFHEGHGVEIAAMARRQPSLIALTHYNLWRMDGFTEVAVHETGPTRIHVFKSNQL
jgi:predicted nicotinamide N-methyase